MTENNEEIKEQTTTCENQETVEEKEQNETNNEKKSFRNSAHLYVTKIESVIMLCVVLTTTLLCSVGINYELGKLNQSLINKADDLSFQQAFLENKIDNLEKTISVLTNDLNEAVETINNKPINITIQSETGSIAQDNTNMPIQPEQNHEPNFDTRPFLGVSFLNDGTENTNKPGLKVDMVYENSPAHFAGIQAGDYITSVNGMTIRTFKDLQESMKNCVAGDALKIDVLSITVNGIEQKTVDVILTQRGNFDIPE